MKTVNARSTAAILMSLAVLCTEASAQSLPINVGDRVRVRLVVPDTAPDRNAPRQELRGAVTNSPRPIWRSRCTLTRRR